MRTLYPLSILLVVTFLFSGCSGMKLANSYKSDDFETLRNKKMLIIARTPIEDVRKAYELDLVSKLQGKGVNAIASHIAFPDLKRIDNKTAERIAEVIAMFRKEGFDIVTLTSLKDVQELDVMRREGGYSSFDEYYGNKYITLRGYYDDVTAPPRLGPKEMDEAITYTTETTYVLEAVTYNLALEEEKRLVSVSTAEITNPDTGKGVRKAFAKIVANELK